jgi:beta-lactamase class A
MPDGDTDALTAVLEAALLPRAGRVSWLVREGAAVLCARDADRWFPGASMIKTFVLVAALRDVEEGRLALDDAVVVGEEHRAGGDGVLGLLDLPAVMGLRDLLALMIAISDNTATNAVLGTIGVAAVNARLTGWGFGSRVRGLSGSSEAPAGWGEGLDLISPAGLSITSAGEHDRLLADICEGRLLSRHGPLAIELLSAQQDRRALARHLGERVRFAHKTGTADGVRHDGGVLWDGGRAIALTVFTDGGPTPETVDHPALVGMGLAMAGIAAALGLDVEVVPS